MNWVQRKIYLYNVTFGLYMLDWWERYLFNTLVIVLLWFVLYNSSRYVTEFCKRNILEAKEMGIQKVLFRSLLEIIEAGGCDPEIRIIKSKP